MGLLKKLREIYYLNNATFLGIIFLILGLILLFSGIGYWIFSLIHPSILDEAYYLISAGAFIAPTGIAIVAIGLSLDSGDRMKVITEDTFLAIGRVTGDRRLELQKKFNQLKIMEENKSYKNTLIYKLYKQDFKESLSYSIWVVYTDLQRVELFKDYLQKDGDLENYQKMILDRIYLYLRFLITGRNYLKMKLSDEYEEHIQEIFDIVKNFSNYSIMENKIHLKEKYEETRGLADLVNELVEK